MQSYDDPRFGVEQCYLGEVSSALNSTVAATELTRVFVNKDMVLKAVRVRCKTGGTDTVRQVLVGKSLAGTGAFAGLGTTTLGTAANNTSKSMTITQGTFAAGDAIVFQHLGTGTEPWVLQPHFYVQETFTNA